MEYILPGSKNERTHKNPCDLQHLVRGSAAITGNINEGSEAVGKYFFFKQSHRATLENTIVKASFL